MNGHRLVLVSQDSRLADAIRTHLRQSLRLPALVCRLESAGEHLGTRADGLLLVALSLPADPEPAFRLIQEVRLRNLPPAALVVQGANGELPAPLADLDGCLAGCLRWPEDAEALGRLVKERLGRWRAPPDVGEETVPDVLARRLLNYTPSLLPMVERIALAAVHDVTVLFTGETGTGKTFLARLMHDGSPRRGEPFLSVPCGAQPPNLLESLFFGHVKGAFTGADRAQPGKFAAAGRGTLLLDEIDTLGLAAQAALLRVIETGEYEPVGGHETRTSQARVVVASNWDLEEAVRQGKFREDLYYRLNVMSFHLPPLRERVQDVGPLVRGMAARFAAKFRKPLFAICPEAMAALENFDWPGNIRQLENAVQQAVLVSKGDTLRPDDLPPALRERQSAGRNGGAGNLLSASRASAERAVIQRALESHGYNRTRTAASLGISRVTLFKKMKQHKLTKPSNGSAHP